MFKTTCILAAVLAASFVHAGESLTAAEADKTDKTVHKTPAGADKTPPTKAIAQANNEFAVSLYRQLADKQKGNLFYSPAGIEIALGMTWLGADGKTADQMAETLRINLPRKQAAEGFAQWIDKLNSAKTVRLPRLKSGRMVMENQPAYQLHVANALWLMEDYPFKEDYLQMVRKKFDSEMKNLDFAGKPEPSRKTINQWVEKQTNNKIKDLIPRGALRPTTRMVTRMVLTNAIYFKSNWEHKFEKGATKDRTFTLAGGKKIKVPMMHQTEHFGYMQADGFQALRMPYKGGDLDMIVLLPDKPAGIDALEKKLSAENLTKWTQAMRADRVEVALPKWKFESSFQLNGVLKKMGMKLAFIDKADFSRMTSAEKLCISRVLHKAFVAVDEEGTEAAAATAVMMTFAAAPARPKTFTADHPFLFAIRHRTTESVLFMGRVMNPKE